MTPVDLHLLLHQLLARLSAEVSVEVSVEACLIDRGMSLPLALVVLRPQIFQIRLVLLREHLHPLPHLLLKGFQVLLLPAT